MTQLRLRWFVTILGAVLGGCPGSGPGDAGSDAADIDADADAAPDETPEETEDDGTEVEDAPGEEASRLPMGAACTDGAQCEGLFCIDESLDPSFVDGYCSALYCDPGFPGSCFDDGACFDTEIYPTLCAALCETDADCRGPDYVCVGTCIPDDFTAPLARPGLLTGTEAQPAAFVAAADDARMMGHVRVLAGETAWDSPGGPVTIVSRAVGHPDRLQAADYLEAQLTGLGWTVERRPFAEGVNLVAERAGTAPALAPVLVTAHWDSIGTSTPGWNAATDPAPGAVDNASGVAVALEIAAILADPATAAPPRTVRIVLFDAEEVGLLGSAAYVAELETAGETIACVMNADMIGWETPPTAGRFWYAFSDASRAWAALGVEAIDLFAPEARAITTDFGDAGRSDGSSFWDAGRCAVGLSSWPREPTNHTVNDTSAAFEPIFATNARAALAVVAAWAYATADP
ncbi:MAG: Zn-dependent exopeptidase M28 [Deltaproteobacteria bacterium]|nr:Zn-dependent exopeptidase M28 [Deltaproteobacteria bacterium]